ncbi:bifunctional phosphoribosylaminoimidazolecarboxamide formyltransferase/IMP cyclohydrolase [bacterium]|nr:bifunctional phosphoribosylaminoimidazolecarboxamide formyltransferase/IMP cyclohydrolase [bacterium]
MAVKIERALISVSDKKGIIEFAKGLENFGVEIVSTGGTYKALKEAGVKVIKIDELTGFPEMLDGRVKTLHPFVHGGILANREIPSHMQQIKDAGIKKIDMVVVNLYPFKETISKPDVKMEEAIENIDIGGPTMIRSAAKNSGGVGVVVDPGDYEIILKEMKENGGKLSKNTMFSLSIKAFKHTCEYDSVIFNYFINKVPQYGSDRIKIDNFLNVDNTNSSKSGKDLNINNFKDGEGNFSEDLNLVLSKKQNLRYGENPHQKASYYKFLNAPDDSFVMAQKLQGKELSYNNIIDGSAAFNIVKEFEKPCVVVTKHNNPCGSAIGKDVLEAYRKAYDADPLSAYGSVIACNYIWTEAAAKFMMDKYVEVLIAPDFEDGALKLMAEKQNLRLLKVKFDLKSYLTKIKNTDFKLTYPDIKSVDGGLIIQDFDSGIDDIKEMKVVTKTSPTEKEWKDLLFGWQIVKGVKSNAILLVKDEVSTGVGAGQMSRVDSTMIAIEKSGGKSKGSVIASDAFFPFPDAIEVAAKNGITAIIQPGGSIRDEEVIEACNRFKISMVFTGKRHFKH